MLKESILTETLLPVVFMRLSNDRLSSVNLCFIRRKHCVQNTTYKPLNYYFLELFFFLDNQEFKYALYRTYFLNVTDFYELTHRLV